MKSKQMFGSVLILCILLLNYGPCPAQQYSPQFQVFLNQIQQTYLAPKGENISVLRRQYPEVMAALIGHALRQQMMYVQQNPSLSNQFTSLQREAQVFITDVARTTSARMQDGSPYSPDGLWYIVNKVYQGQEEDWILQNFRVQTGTMPLVMAASPGAQPSGPLGDPFTKEEKTNIDLLGQRAPPVTGPPTEQRPQPTPQRQITLNPDGIQGNWSTIGGKTQLKIWKQGDVYLGTMSGEQIFLYGNIKRNEVCLRLKHAGGGVNGPIFKGQYLQDKGGLSKVEWKWVDVTFYYHLSLGTERLGTDESVYKGGMPGTGMYFKRQ